MKNTGIAIDNGLVRVILFMVFSLWLFLALGCSQDDQAEISEPLPSPLPERQQQYSLGGQVSGLEGVGLILQVNSSQQLQITADGSFAFEQKMASGVDYEVTVRAQPSDPDQLCRLTGGAKGTLHGDKMDINLLCMSRGRLVSAQWSLSPNSAYLKQVFSQMGIAIIPKHNVTVYKIVYTSLAPDKSIILHSGLALIPADLDQSLPMISLQHGSIFRQEEAPSRNPREGILEASQGYFTLVPDYLGFGESGQFFHPYHIVAHASSTVIDIIRAGREFAAQQNRPLSDKLFLKGYSEGAFVTLAAMKDMETNHSTEFTLTAVSPAAGAYNLSMTTKMLVSENEIASPSLFLYLVKAYREYYNLDVGYDYFFQQPFADRADELMSSELSGALINSQLSTTSQKLFNLDTLENLRQGEESIFTPLLEQNNLLDGWVPQAPIKLYHCEQDSIVPIENSEEAFAKFLENGSSITLEVAKGDHGDCPLIFSAVQWFDSLK